MLNSNYNIKLPNDENLSRIELEAIKWHQILEQSSANFRALQQKIIPALQAIGTDSPYLIIESVKLLSSAYYIGSFDISSARASAAGLLVLAQNIYEVKDYLLEYKIDYIQELCERRAKIESTEWVEVTTALSNILKLLNKAQGSHEKHKQKFFPPKSQFDYYLSLRMICRSAKREVFITDPYADQEVISLLENIELGVRIMILAINDNRRGREDLKLGAQKYKEQYNSIQLRLEELPGECHDRYIIIDKHMVYNLGSSINGGRKTASINPYHNLHEINSVYETMMGVWNKAIIVI